MKKKNVISAILTASIVMATALGGTVSASDKTESLFSEATSYVEQDLSFDNVTVTQILPLYNTSDEVIAYLCQLNSEGYAVYDPIYKTILEFSLEDDRDLFLNPHEKYYYVGITQFYTKQQLSQVSKADATLSIPDESYTTADFYFTEPVDKLNNEDLPGTGETISHSTRLYNCNVKKNFPYFGIIDDCPGVCGSVACSIVAAYFDDYIDDNYCDDAAKNSGRSSDNTYGKDLVKEMVSAVEPLKGNALVLWGMNDYLNAHGISDEIHLDAFSGNYGMALKQVDKDEPYIIGVAEILGAEQGDHWMVGLGWIKTLGGTYIVANDGYGNDDVNVKDGVIATNWYID